VGRAGASAREVIVGLISDTHGLLRPQALAALDGCGLILHAGDVGSQEILETLRTVAPLTVVRGNIDRGAWAMELPVTATVAAGTASIYMLHDVQQLDLDPAAHGFNLVVSGHSHKPGRTDRGGVMYVNPGSAGPRRFRLPITVARIDLGVVPWVVEWIELESDHSR
jgi:uncharacterized protein